MKVKHTVNLDPKAIDSLCRNEAFMSRLVEFLFAAEKIYQRQQREKQAQLEQQGQADAGEELQ